MKPDEFYALALRLVAVGKTAECRSALSRAYYSAAHVAKETLESMGVRLPPGNNMHSLIPNLLSNSNDPRLSRAGHRLREIQSKRIKADYKLSDRESENAKSVAVWIADAGEVIQIVQETFSGKNAIIVIASIQSYIKLVYNFPAN